MKKILIVLSLLTTSNCIVTSAHAELSEHIIPALKIAGGALASVTAAAYAKDILDQKYDVDTLGIPACISAAILAAMAFDCTKDINIPTVIKIAGATAMGCSAAFYAFLIPLYNYGIKPSADRDTTQGTKLFGPGLITTALLSAIAFKSAANDLFGK